MKFKKLLLKGSLVFGSMLILAACQSDNSKETTTVEVTTSQVAEPTTVEETTIEETTEEETTKEETTEEETTKEETTKEEKSEATSKEEKAKEEKSEETTKEDQSEETDKEDQKETTSKEDKSEEDSKEETSKEDKKDEMTEEESSEEEETSKEKEDKSEATSKEDKSKEDETEESLEETSAEDQEKDSSDDKKVTPVAPVAEEEPLQDGDYSVKGEANELGWHLAHSIKVEEGEVVESDFDYLNEKGDRLSEDEEYNLQMEQATEVTLKDAIDELNEAFLADPTAKIKVVAGANETSKHFKKSAETLLDLARQGDTKETMIEFDQEMPALKDGDYILEGEANEEGWAVEHTIQVKDGQIIESVFDYVNEEGEKLSEDKEANEAFEKDHKQTLKDVFETLDEALVNEEDLDAIEIEGAEDYLEDFKASVEVLIEQAKDDEAASEESSVDQVKKDAKEKAEDLEKDAKDQVDKLEKDAKDKADALEKDTKESMDKIEKDAKEKAEKLEKDAKDKAEKLEKDVKDKANELEKDAKDKADKVTKNLKDSKKK